MLRTKVKVRRKSKAQSTGLNTKNKNERQQSVENISGNSRSEYNIPTKDAILLMCKSLEL